MIKKYIGHRPDVGILILRLALGAVFIAHGYSKFAGGVDGVAGFFTNLGIPMALLMAWIVTLVEFFGGLALVLGVGVRVSALLLSIIILVAIFTAKFKLGFIGGYELDLALLAGLLALLFGGSGKYSMYKGDY